jgi:hypothetical protein
MEGKKIAVVLNIGRGLDTSFQRVDDGRTWTSKEWVYGIGNCTGANFDLRPTKCGYLQSGLTVG